MRQDIDVRKVVCTVGTSLLTNARHALGQTASQLKARACVSQYRKSLAATSESKEAFHQQLSAETHSLTLLRLRPSDQIVLLHTDTEEGSELAELLEEIIKEEFAVSVSRHRVVGLQIDDADRFRKIGLHNLYSLLHTECIQWQQEDPTQRRKAILNTTAGYKAIVPYMTILGCIFRIEVVYVFEKSNTLIRLPPLPLQFDYERLAQAREALQYLKHEGIITKDEFFGRMPELPYEERTVYEGLLEEDDTGHVTLSSLGLFFVEQWERDTKEVYLSPEVVKVYESVDSTRKDFLSSLFDYIADPLWRGSHRHSFAGTDLDVFKLPHRQERIAAIIQGSKIYVCCLYLSHDKYERDFPKRRKEEFQPNLKSFQAWSLLKALGHL